MTSEPKPVANGDGTGQGGSEAEAGTRVATANSTSTSNFSLSGSPPRGTPAIIPSSSPPPYRRRVETVTLPVDPSSIAFTPTDPSASHPFDCITVHLSSPSTQEALQNAAALLRENQTVAFPTETVYGLGANALSTEAARSIFAAKSRPLDNPLIVHVSSLSQLRSLTPDIPKIYDPLISRFWPGPLTILLPLPEGTMISKAVTATQSTFAARMPSHPIALALAYMSALPLAAPSANASGRPSPTTAAHVAYDLAGSVPLILDGGACTVGLESTVVDGLRSPPAILRPGGVTIEAIRAVGGDWENVTVAYHIESDKDVAPRAPGMKYQHYSPRAGVVLHELGAGPPKKTDLLKMTFGGQRRRIGVLTTRTWELGTFAKLMEGDGIEVVERSLGKTGEEIQGSLFRALREMDEEEVAVIYVEGIEEVGEGLAIMNRLGKAASVVVGARR